MTAKVDHGKTQFPLAGVVMCCTSISPERRTELASIAVQMGAVHKYDLTSDVTHLIVGSIDTLKYKYVAKERPDVKVVIPTWIHAIRDLWMEGEDTDVAALEDEYRAPIFLGLKLCLTGFDDVVQRLTVSESITRNGAEYHGDLTKSVTHLIAAKPQGKKYNYACQWKIRIVSPEWLQDSISRGMVLDEDLFNPNMPQEERGRGAWNREVLQNKDRKRSVDGEAAPSFKAPGRKKLRRTASLKVGSQNERIWADITSAATERVRVGNDWRPSSIETKLSENTELSHADPAINNENMAAAPSDIPAPTKHSTDPPNGLFRGRIVCITGFDEAKMRILNGHLVAHGANVIVDESELLHESQDELGRGFLLIPHDTDMSDLSIPSAAQQMAKVTEWWVEKCLHRKILLEADEDVLCQPLSVNNIEGFESMIFASTSFSGVDLMHVTKAIKILGGSYDEFLNHCTSVLICNSLSPNKEKLKFAYSKEIPTVTADWLWACIKSGRKLPFDDYSLIRSEREFPHNKPSYIEEPTQPLSTSERSKSDERRAARAAERRSTPMNQIAAKPMERTLSMHDSKTLYSASSDYSAAIVDLDEKTSSENHFSGVEDGTLPLRDSSPKNTAEIERAEDDAGSGTKTSQNLTKDLAALLTQKQPRGITSLNGVMADTNRDRRRRRLLGRAASASSNASKGVALSREHSAHQSQPKDDDIEAFDGDKQDTCNMQPSQALIYDDPELQKAREAMIRKMGGRVENEARRVESIGAVKDSAQEEAVGRPSRRKGR